MKENIPSQVSSDDYTLEERQTIRELVERARPIEVPSQQNDRVTVSLNMHYQQFGENPVSGISQFSFVTPKNEDPPLSRWVWVSEEWQPLDTGWVGDVGYVLLESRAGKGLSSNPSDTQRQEIEKQIVEVCLNGFHESAWPVRPGRACCLDVGNETIHVRCLHGKVKLNLTLFPS